MLGFNLCLTASHKKVAHHDFTKCHLRRFNDILHFYTSSTRAATYVSSRDNNRSQRVGRGCTDVVIIVLRYSSEKKTGAEWYRLVAYTVSCYASALHLRPTMLSTLYAMYVCNASVVIFIFGSPDIYISRKIGQNSIAAWTTNGLHGTYAGAVIQIHTYVHIWFWAKSRPLHKIETMIVLWQKVSHNPSH